MRKCTTIRLAKTKALISFAVTAKLICAFVFANADCWFSYGAAQIYFHKITIMAVKIIFYLIEAGVKNERLHNCLT